MLKWGDIAAILGSVASILAGIRWLLSVYFRMQTRLDNARKIAFAAEASQLRNEIRDLKEKIQLYKKELDDIGIKLELCLRQFEGARAQGERIYSAMRGFVIEAEKRFESLENGKLEIKEKLKPAVGKVIVKK